MGGYYLMMLGDVLKKYENFKKTNQKTLETLKEKLQRNFEQNTIQALKIQNHKVSKIHSNQQEIENRLRRNTELQSQMKVHLGGWVMLYEQLNKALKEAGHLNNYAEYVHEEIKQMATQLKSRLQNPTNRYPEVQQGQDIGNVKDGKEELEKINSNQIYDTSDMV